MQFPFDVNTVLTYFSGCDFYDRSCNNEEYKMQAATVLVPFPSAAIFCMSEVFHSLSPYLGPRPSS